MLNRALSRQRRLPCFTAFGCLEPLLAWLARAKLDVGHAARKQDLASASGAGRGFEHAGAARFGDRVE